MDFTIKNFLELINKIHSKDYVFQSYFTFIDKPESKAIILRHDVDALPKNALKFAH